MTFRTPPEPAELEQIRTSGHEVYQPEPLAARRRDRLGETGAGWWAVVGGIALLVLVLVVRAFS